LRQLGPLSRQEEQVQRDRQEEIVSVVDHDELAAGTLDRRVIDEYFSALCARM
jgi:hypothetical protein